MTSNIEDLHRKIMSVINRTTEIDALNALIHALRPVPANVSMDETVIAFDANVFLRLSNHARGEDIVDFLRSSFSGFIILPGQVIQEFWNNQFQAVESVAASIKKKHKEIKIEVAKVDASFEDFSAKFETLTQEFHEKYGYIYDENTLRKTTFFLNLLAEKAKVPYVPREMFVHSASVRKRTKTPPGFKDDGDGDFFVWVDLLLGLSQLSKEGKVFKRVAFISNEKKLDWTRDGTPHPILAAEVSALTNASLEIWNIDTLAGKLLE